jgi:hypothetical protein
MLQLPVINCGLAGQTVREDDEADVHLHLPAQHQLYRI